MHVRTKDLPQVGVFGHVRNFLYGEKLWEVSVKFVDKIDNLGVSYDDRMRVDVQAFGPEGSLKGWRGSYGGSSAMMYSNDIAAVATGGKFDLENLPEDRVVLELHRHWKKSWVTMYLNPCHQAAMLPPKRDDVDMNRVAKILKVFTGLISSARQTPLHGLQVTQEEFGMLVDNGWLKCHKGKKPELLPKPIYTGGAYDQYKYYDLNGASVTTEGKNVVETYKVEFNY
jgi:hypothetical protein